MPGLLDFLNTDDARFGIGLLAAGGPTTDPNRTSFGQRMSLAMADADARKRAKLQDEVYRSQMMENTSQAQYRQGQNALLARKLKMEEEFMGYPDATASGEPTIPTVAPPSTDAPAAGGAPQAGSLPPMPPPLAAKADAMPIQTPSGPMTAPQIAAKTGIDVNAIRADRLFNDGKKIGEWLKEASGPLPGSAVMVNNIPHIVQPDRSLKPQGGALDTYRTQKLIDTAATARGRDLKVLDEGSGRWVAKPASEVLGLEAPLSGAAPAPAAAPPAAPLVPGPAALSQPRPGPNPMARRPEDSDRALIYGQERRTNAANLAKAQASGDPAAIHRAQMDIAALEKEIVSNKIDLPPLGTTVATAPTAPPTTVATPTAAAAPAGNVVEKSAKELAAEGRQKAYQEMAGKDDAAMRKGIMTEGFAASGKINRLRQIEALLKDHDGGKLSNTGLELASAMNSLGISVDKNLGNKEAADALSKALSLQFRDTGEGGGMPGALSDSDREFLIRMTPNLTQSKDGRRKLVQMYVGIEQRKQQVATFARNYEKKYGELNHGFYDQLQEWSNANNMFGGR